MNERIRDLIAQATKVVEPNDPDYRHEIFDKVKFAELIVRECTNMLPEDSIRNAEGVHMFYVIRERFGVSAVGR